MIRPETVFRLHPLAIAAAVIALPGLATAQACPDYTGAVNQELIFSAAQLSQPQRFDMVAGGNVDLGNCVDVPGYGHVVTGPDYHLNLTGTQPGTSIAVRVEGECDTILLANDAWANWHYDDDSGANWFDPELILPAADGIYDFWVGTWDTELCRATFSLQVASTAALNPCPDPALPPAQTLGFTAGELAQGQRFDVVAGGDMQLARCAEIEGYGTVVNYPDFAVNLSGTTGTDLIIGLEGQDYCDTILVVSDANGGWHYNDDHEDLSSQVRIRSASDGQYHIWTGTWGEEMCYAALTLRTEQGLTKPGLGGPEPVSADDGVPAMEDPGNLVAYRNLLGSTLSIRVTGSTDGAIWGSGPYSDDSAVAVAAVHAGLVAPGETAVVRVMIAGPQSGFIGADMNGVSSNDYGSWGGSYEFQY